MILVPDLDRAARDYSTLGFRVTPGGVHADGLTRNALVPFRDGTYLELVSFLDPDDPTDNVWGWRHLADPGGLVDHCAASEDLRTETESLARRGLPVEGPFEGGRRTPLGEEIRWLVTRFRQQGKALPFLIQDLTPRRLRVPPGPAAEHPNGATGIKALAIATSDPQQTAARLAALTGEQGPSRFRLGPHALTLAHEKNAARAGPTEAVLTTNGAGETLDPRTTHGARLRLEPET